MGLRRPTPSLKARQAAPQAAVHIEGRRHFKPGGGASREAAALVDQQFADTRHAARWRRANEVRFCFDDALDVTAVAAMVQALQLGT